MEPMYSVPVIPQNLRREETIVQIADALNYLSETTNDIFKRINDRIAINQRQVNDVSKRIEAADAKVNRLRGAKKAIQVFSSSKYPATDTNKKYVSIFNGEKLAVRKTKIEYDEAFNSYEPLEKLQFYHVKVKDSTAVVPKHGLGGVPSDVTSVNDVLIYNTGKNPYKNYVMSDTLKLTHRLKEEQQPETSDIGAAPLSISDRQNQNTKLVNDSYFYLPDLGDVPTIDVPLDLPDLPGIADDLRYVSETGPGIAPSVTTTPIVPDLPLLEPATSITKTCDVKIETVTAPPVLPPPPPPVQSVEESASDVPPKPPPLPIAPEVTLEIHPNERERHADAKPSVIDKKAKTDSGNMRANLMEAIRNSGGKAKLRATDETASANAAAGGGDLMADLHAKLSMRRKGISGAKNPESGFDSSSTLSKISSMIPPPPTKSDLTDTATEDEDWDD